MRLLLLHPLPTSPSPSPSSTLRGNGNGNRRHVRLPRYTANGDGDGNGSSSSPPGSGSGGGGASETARPGMNMRGVKFNWSSPDEGWVGGPNAFFRQEEEDQSSSSSSSSYVDLRSADSRAVNDMLLSLLAQASDTHYQFLGVSPTAEVEEIKAAYRRLSKLYHPDTTSLPLDIAAKKFVRLTEAYDVLSSAEERRLYERTLAQEVSRRQGGRFQGPGSRPPKWGSQDLKPFVAKVDALGGRNMELSDQAQTAILFDLVAILFAICCCIYVAFFKH